MSIGLSRGEARILVRIRDNGRQMLRASETMAADALVELGLLEVVRGHLPDKAYECTDLGREWQDPRAVGCRCPGCGSPLEPEEYERWLCSSCEEDANDIGE